MPTYLDKLCLIGLITGVLLTSLLANPLAAAESKLEEHLWRHRLLIVAAPDAIDPETVKQLRVLSDRTAAIEDRDVKVYQLYLRGGNSYQALPLNRQVSDAIRDELDIGADTKALILIGKDGGVKRRAPLNSDLIDFFVQIDEMPMRQLEIKEKQRAGLPVTLP